MAFIPTIQSLISTNNSTSTTLGANAIFSGTGEDVSQYTEITLFHHSDVSGATNGIELQQSIDNINWDIVSRVDPNHTSILFSGNHVLIVTSQFFRFIYINGDTEQTEFRTQIILHNAKNKLQTVPLGHTITESSDSHINRSVIMGKDVAGNYKNIPVNHDGHLRIGIAEPTTSFGSVSMAELTPQIQVSFPYNINTDIIKTGQTSGGSISQVDGKIRLETSGITNSSANARTIRTLKYRPGQGAMCRFTARFTTGADDSTQWVGIGDESDGYFFGYSGETFGVMNRNNSGETFTAQTSWNLDKLDGKGELNNASNMKLDTTKGNVYQIQYEWLGFGAISYFVEHDEDGEFIPVHIDAYTNKNTVPSTLNPTLPICYFVGNTGNTSNIILESSSAAGFVEGKVESLGPLNTTGNTKTISTTTSILTIRNKSNYQNRPNRVECLIKNIAVSSEGNKTVKVEVIEDTTLGGSPVFNNINTDTSVCEFDIAGTTVTGGKKILTVQLAKSDGKEFTVTDGLIIRPGKALTFAATSQATNEVDVAVTWIEDF